MIYIECDLDTFFVGKLGVKKSDRKHCVGKWKAFSQMHKYQGFAIIDRDPQASEDTRTKEYEKYKENGSLSFFRKRQDHNSRFCYISPELEDWLFKLAKENGIAPKTYGLPASPEEWKNVPHLEGRKGFKDFLDVLLSKRIPEIEELKREIH